MVNRNQIQKFLMVTVGVCASAAGASADTLSALFNGASPSRNVSLSLDGGESYDTVTAGLMNWTRTGGSSDAPAGDFTTFCIELDEHVAPSHTYNYDVVPIADAPTSLDGMGELKGDLLGELFDLYYGTSNFAFGDVAAAFQIAVWEIVYDDGVDLAGGIFRVANSGSHYGLADDMLDGLTGQYQGAPVIGLASRGSQDQVTVPEPASLGLLLLGIAGLLRRR